MSYFIEDCNKDEMHERAVRAAERYVALKECTNIAKNWKSEDGEYGFDLIFDDEGTLVLGNVGVYTKTQAFPGARVFTDKDIDKMERGCIAYLSENDSVVDRAVRFDFLAMTVFDSSRAIIKHYVNAAGGRF